MKHHTTRPGAEVLIKLMNGEQFVDTFVKANDRYIWLGEKGRFHKSEIRQFQDYVPGIHGEHGKKT